MSDREEAMLAVGQHFQELTALMRGSQAASDEKLQKIVDATSSMPVLGQQQLETLQSLSQQMEKQNELGEKLSTTMTRLPNLLESVEKALDRAAKTDERTAATVLEFQSTMDRIHTSMDKMVGHSGDQAKAAQDLANRRTDELKGLATDIAKAQDGAVEELKRTTDEGLQQLRRTHEDQSNRLQKVVEEHAGWNRAVLVGIGLVVLGIGAVIVLQLMK
ncbi:MAG: methyl-accepting chemotaxis protein [Planctomycetota bacterium]|jgi:methyl-accepting chemotaxis protein